MQVAGLGANGAIALRNLDVFRCIDFIAYRAAVATTLMRDHGVLL